MYGNNQVHIQWLYRIRLYNGQPETMEQRATLLQLLNAVCYSVTISELATWQWRHNYGVIKRCIARSRSCTYHPSLSCKTVHDSAVDYLDSLAAPLLTDTVCVLKYRARDIQEKIRVFHMHTHKIRVFHVTHIVDTFFFT